MLRLFLDDRCGSFSLFAALFVPVVIAVSLVGFDHLRFATLKSALPDAALQATVPAAQSMMRGTNDVKKLNSIAEGFLSTNLPLAEPDTVRVSLELVKNPKNGHVEQLKIKASAKYQPISGPLAALFPAYSKSGEAWTATFGD